MWWRTGLPPPCAIRPAAERHIRPGRPLRAACHQRRSTRTEDDTVVDMLAAAIRRDILLMRLATETPGLRGSIAPGDVAWESRVAAALHALTRAEAQVQAIPDDMTTLNRDEACRAATEALVSACDSPRLIEMARKFYSQSRRFSLALLREGRIDFQERHKRQERLKEAILARDGQTSIRLLAENIKADIGI